MATIPTIASYKARQKGWYSRSELLAMRLRVPRNLSPVAQAWSYIYYPVYDKDACIPMGDKKPLTDAQQAALQKGYVRLFKRVCASCNATKDKEDFVFWDENGRERKRSKCDDCVNDARLKKFEDDADGAYLEAVELVSNGGLLILDTETTGLDGDAEICEIAIINLRKEVVFTSLIKTSKPLSDEVIAIHGITNEMLADAPTWQQVYDHVKVVLDGQTVAIYNSDYDKRVIKQTCGIYGLAMLDFDAPCVMAMFAKYYGDWNDNRKSYKWQKLSKAANLFNSEHTNDAHRAAADCRMTVDVLYGMASKIKMHSGC